MHLQLHMGVNTMSCLGTATLSLSQPYPLQQKPLVWFGIVSYNSVQLHDWTRRDTCFIGLKCEKCKVAPENLFLHIQPGEKIYRCIYASTLLLFEYNIGD